MAIQSAVACSEAKDDGLLVSWQLMERVLVWVVSFSLAVEDGFLFIMDKSFGNGTKQEVSIRIKAGWSVFWKAQRIFSDQAPSHESKKKGL